MQELVTLCRAASRPRGDRGQNASQLAQGSPTAAAGLVGCKHHFGVWGSLCWGVHRLWGDLGCWDWGARPWVWHRKVFVSPGVDGARRGDETLLNKSPRKGQSDAKRAVCASPGFKGT